MNDTIRMEATLEQGESESDVLHALSARIEKWHKENSPHLYQEPSQHYHGLGPIPEHQKPDPIPIISKDHEKIEIAIDNATTLEDLQKIKESHPLMTVPLMTLWNNKRIYIIRWNT